MPDEQTSLLEETPVAAEEPAQPQEQIVVLAAEVRPQPTISISQPQKPEPTTGKKDDTAPLCYNCGNQTQRAGTCYVCTSCGSTTGCS